MNHFWFIKSLFLHHPEPTRRIAHHAGFFVALSNVIAWATGEAPGDGMFPIAVKLEPCVAAEVNRDRVHRDAEVCTSFEIWQLRELKVQLVSNPRPAQIWIYPCRTDFAIVRFNWPCGEETGNELDFSLTTMHDFLRDINHSESFTIYLLQLFRRHARLHDRRFTFQTVRKLIPDPSRHMIWKTFKHTLHHTPHVPLSRNKTSHQLDDSFLIFRIETQR